MADPVNMMAQMNNVVVMHFMFFNPRRIENQFFILL